MPKREFAPLRGAYAGAHRGRNSKFFDASFFILKELIKGYISLYWVWKSDTQKVPNQKTPSPNLGILGGLLATTSSTGAAGCRPPGDLLVLVG